MGLWFFCWHPTFTLACPNSYTTTHKHGLGYNCSTLGRCAPCLLAGVSILASARTPHRPGNAPKKPANRPARGRARVLLPRVSTWVSFRGALGRPKQLLLLLGLSAPPPQPHRRPKSPGCAVVWRPTEALSKPPAAPARHRHGRGVAHGRRRRAKVKKNERDTTRRAAGVISPRPRRAAGAVVGWVVVPRAVALAANGGSSHPSSPPSLPSFPHGVSPSGESLCWGREQSVGERLLDSDSTRPSSCLRRPPGAWC